MAWLEHPAVTEREYTKDEVEFLLAIEGYQKRVKRKFLTYTEILDIAKSLGYSKTENCRNEHDDRSETGIQG